MNSRISRQMSLLGLGVLAFYGAMLASGQVSLEVLPQFAVSAVIFLSSGRLMRQMARQLPAKDEEEEPREADRPEPDWALRTAVLNWVAASLVVTVMAVFLVKPVGMTFTEMCQVTFQQDRFPALAMP